MTWKTCANTSRRPAFVLAGCLAGAIGGIASADWTQGPKLVGFDPRADDTFGAAIALSGDAAIVGAPGDNFLGLGGGSIHMFRHNGATWSQQAKIYASDVGEFDAFGTAVAIAGDVAVVGAPADDDLGDESGSVYVLRYNGASWNEEAKLTASDGFDGDAFGQTVATTGDRIVVGAPGSDPEGDGQDVDSGAVYVFVFDGEEWVEEAKLIGSDTAPADEFGRSVAMHADAILIGAPIHAADETDNGAAYLFRFDGEGWVEEAKLLASDGAFGDEFGAKVALSKGVAIVGAHLHGEDDEGTAYVFRFDGEWMEEAELMNPDPVAGDHFGAALAISGGLAVVGSPNDDEKDDDSGAAHVFRYDDGAWFDESKLLASDGAAGDAFGRAVGLIGEKCLVGAPLDDDNDTDSGSVYEYDFSPAERPALVGEMASDLFGRAIANAGDVDGDEIDDLLIGAPYNDANGATSGKIYVYSGATLDLIHERAGSKPGDRFGWAVAGIGDVNNDGFADYSVSAPWAKKSRGRVYVYSGINGALLRVMTGEKKGDRFGYALAGGVDVNRDGRGDILVGAPKNDENGNNSGKAYAFSGKNWKLLGEMLGEAKGDKFGSSIAGLAKANGDGFADFVVGAPKNDDKAKSAGKVYVINGKKFKVLYALKGKKAGDQFGYSVGAIGLANGDDRTDFIVGSPYYDRGANASAGRIDVYSGKNGTRLFSRNGENANDRMGQAVGGTADVDGDGRADVLIGAPRHDTAGSNAGRVYVRSGATGAMISIIDGDEAGDMLGWAVAGAGDVDGDELGDLLIAAPLNDAGETNAGQAYLKRSTDELPDAGTWNEPADSDEVANDPADLNGDGTVDATDIAALLAAWGNGDSAADLNGDGIVDEDDLQEILDAS